MFLKKISYGQKDWFFDQKCNKNSNIVKYYYNVLLQIFLNLTVFYFNMFLIYFCDGKAEFSASLLQSSVSHDPLRSILIGWFDAFKKHLLLMFKCASKYFYGNQSKGQKSSIYLKQIYFL